MEENDNNNAPKYRTMRSIIEHQIRLREARQLREAMGYQHERNALGITLATRPKIDSEAVARLQTQELQEVKQELVDAGLIEDGRWIAGSANFECLVKLFRDVFGIKTKKGDLARKTCASFVGFTGNLDSARSSTHNEQQSPEANQIKAICRRIHEKYVK